MIKKPILIVLYKKIFSQETITRFQKNFLTGLFVALPSLATIWIIALIIRVIGSPVGEVINNLFAEGNMDSFLKNILGFLIAILFLVCLGYFAKLAFIRSISIKIEDYIETIPLINTIYSTIKSIVNSIRSNSQAFQSVAIVEYPRKGIYSLALITQNDFPVTKTKSGKKLENMASVFIPTTPNITTGFFALLPKEDIELLDLPIDEGLKLIISAGAIQPIKKAVFFENDVFVEK
jgi:uncharacterized membrane protein